MPKKMTFWDHLAELRKCIFNIILPIAIFSMFFFMFGLREGNLFGYKIIYPFPDMTNNISNLVFRQVVHDLLPEQLDLFPTRLIDPILITVQISLFLGTIISTPMIYYQIAKFVGPGLYPHEKRSLRIITIPATFLFIVGCLFSYYVITPFMIDFMYLYFEPMETLPMISLADFISFVLMMTLAFGIIFELPVFMVGFTKIGLVTSDFWKKHWRMAFVIMILIGAVITPDGSGITQLIVAVPMMVLYFVGYICSKYVHTRKLKV